MRLRFWRKPKVVTRYWINGHGPFETAAERDDFHETLRQVAAHNRAMHELIEREEALRG